MMSRTSSWLKLQERVIPFPLGARGPHDHILITWNLLNGRQVLGAAVVSGIFMGVVDAEWSAEEGESLGEADHMEGGEGGIPFGGSGGRPTTMGAGVGAAERGSSWRGAGAMGGSGSYSREENDERRWSGGGETWGVADDRRGGGRWEGEGGHTPGQGLRRDRAGHAVADRDWQAFTGEGLRRDYASYRVLSEGMRAGFGSSEF